MRLFTAFREAVHSRTNSRKETDKCCAPQCCTPQCCAPQCCAPQGQLPRRVGPIACLGSSISGTSGFYKMAVRASAPQRPKRNFFDYLGAFFLVPLKKAVALLWAILGHFGPFLGIPWLPACQQVPSSPKNKCPPRRLPPTWCIFGGYPVSKKKVIWHFGGYNLIFGGMIRHSWNFWRSPKA